MKFGLIPDAFEESLLNLDDIQQEQVCSLFEEFKDWVEKQSGKNLSAYKDIQHVASNQWKKWYTTQTARYDFYFNYLEPSLTFQLQKVELCISIFPPNPLRERIKLLSKSSHK